MIYILYLISLILFCFFYYDKYILRINFKYKFSIFYLQIKYFPKSSVHLPDKIFKKKFKFNNNISNCISCNFNINITKFNSSSKDLLIIYTPLQFNGLLFFTQMIRTFSRSTIILITNNNLYKKLNKNIKKILKQCGIIVFPMIHKYKNSIPNAYYFKIYSIYIFLTFFGKKFKRVAYMDFSDTIIQKDPFSIYENLNKNIVFLEGKSINDLTKIIIFDRNCIISDYSKYFKTNNELYKYLNSPQINFAFFIGIPNNILKMCNEILNNYYSCSNDQLILNILYRLGKISNLINPIYNPYCIPWFYHNNDILLGNKVGEYKYKSIEKYENFYIHYFDWIPELTEKFINLCYNKTKFLNIEKKYFITKKVRKVLYRNNKKYFSDLYDYITILIRKKKFKKKK